MKVGLIAGGGDFPLLTARAARDAGHEIAVVAVTGEASPRIETVANSCHWVSLGQLSRLIDAFRSEGVTRVLMAGRIRHQSIFSAIRPDWRLLKLLNELRRKNTDSLLGGVANVLENEGISILESTYFLHKSLAGPGPNGRRKPTRAEQADIRYGLEIAKGLARLDIGQSVVICEQACVAVEAMEGTDAVVRRAAGLANGRKLTLVKVAKPHQDMRFDVPVIGLRTIRTMYRANATAISVEANKTLLLEKEELLTQADGHGISVFGS